MNALEEKLIYSLRKILNSGVNSLNQDDIAFLRTIKLYDGSYLIDFECDIHRRAFDWDNLKSGDIIETDNYPLLTFIGKSSLSKPQSFLFECEDGGLVRFSKRFLKKYAVIKV